MSGKEDKRILVEAEAVEKTYRIGATDLKVLRGVSLSIAAGESVAIMGPSGAGKSTLLHMLGGLDRPTAGRVWFKGRDFYALAAGERSGLRARHVGFVFQSYHLLPELTILENVLLPAMACNAAGAAGRRRAAELLEGVGLDARLKHTPLELSGGEQQRTALARALMNEPELLLADEPTGNLDTSTGEQILKYLFELTRRRKHTLVLVTHNAAVAGRCDRTIHLVDGRITG